MTMSQIAQVAAEARLVPMAEARLVLMAEARLVLVPDVMSNVKGPVPTRLAHHRPPQGPG